MKIRKNPKSNLENKRKVFLEIGFVIALLFVLLAFEYRSYEKHTIVLPKIESYDIIEVEIPITKDKPEMPKPLPVAYREIAIVDNTTEINSDDFPEIIFDEGTFDDWVPTKEPEEVLIDDIPVRFVSDKAEFPGGMPALYKFLADRIEYPDGARELGVQGKVYIDFVIEKDGRVTNVVVLKGVGYGCDEEAVRVIESMPLWKPAKQNHHKVRMAMTIPVKFTLRQ